MGRHCAAFGCSNSEEKNKKFSLGLTFHRFPVRRPDALKAWVHAVKRKGFNPTEHSYLCSSHFTEEDFQYQPFTGRYKHLIYIYEYDEYYFLNDLELRPTLNFERLPGLSYNSR